MIVYPEQFNQPAMDYIKDRYMGLADDLMMVYVPMHVNNHWYLMVIDFWDKKLVYLDSFKSADHNETTLRLSLMVEVATYLEHVIQNTDFWDDKTIIPPTLSDFEPIYPDAGQQPDGTLDVCQWMMNSQMWLDYTLDEVNDNTRMAIALDLVTSEHNPLGETISDRAVNYWDAEML
ncbi:hypothetical protein PIB30_050484 [Stylosanthes scabra]|uniref:Ubiquitin-like protease family profile domain-containing protein n=1 Tax=Stylosanthes scabra TaxID=79078 RepID=A0ABU6YGH1_9FABA|nr:hypothetical protein [Stylosanthes scabra]